MATSFAGIVNAVMSDYSKTVTDATLKQHKILALLQDRGRLTYNHSGENMEDRIKFKQAQTSFFGDGTRINYSRLNRYKPWVLPLNRGYYVSDSITIMEKEQCKGETLLIPKYSQKGKMLVDEIQEHLNVALLHDGNATNYTQGFHGIESWFSVSGASTKSPIGLPNDTYAGLSTALANYGGTWSTTGSNTTYTDWPFGKGEVQYDFNSPVVVNYTSTITTDSAAGNTGWDASTKTFPNTCLEATRYGLDAIRSRVGGMNGQIEVITYESQLFRQFKNKLQAEEHINVSRNDGPSGLYRLGFGDVINFDGCDITSLPDLDAGIGYGWNLSLLELCIMTKDLVMVKGPDYSPSDGADVFAAFVLGNMKNKLPQGWLKFKPIG